MKDLKIVTVEDIHQKLVGWISEKRVIIGDYEDMKKMVLSMIRGGNCFVMERDRLRDAMEDISYMMNAEDDALKDRVLRSLEYEDESTDDEYFDDHIQPHIHGPECHKEDKEEDKEDAEDIEDIGNTSDRETA